MNWNDELCGVKVTPESWAGGVVHWPGDDKSREGWAIAGSHVFPANSAHPHAFLGIDGWCYRCDLLTPIFPPKGWAGKTDAELWAAVFGGDDCRFKGEGYDEWELEFWLSGSIWLRAGYPGDGRIGYTEIDKPAALILALQNAQVLARRLA